MDPSAKADIRAVLMARAERDGIGATAKPSAEPAVGRARVRRERDIDTTPVRPRRSARAKVAALVGVAVGTLALSGISAASGDAMPGDPLYGLKRSQESAQLALAGSPEAKAKLDLDFAAIRLVEAQTVRANSHELNGTLGDMDAEISAGLKLLFKSAIAKHSTSPLDTVDAFLTQQLTGLGLLRDGVVGGDAIRTLRSVTKLNLFQLRSQAIRQVLDSCADVKLTNDPIGPDAVCVENGHVNPPSPSPKTTGTGTGKGGTHGQATSPNRDPNSTTGASPKTGAAVSGGVTVANPSGTEGGLLGDIGHLLGGLLGH